MAEIYMELEYGSREQCSFLSLINLEQKLSVQSGKGESFSPPPHTIPDQVRDRLRMRVPFDKLRTCALGGPLELSSRSRVMDVYPQIFDRQQPLILEPLISHARLGGQCAGESSEAWIEIHKEDLMADWELASSGQEIFKIDPLK